MIDATRRWFRRNRTRFAVSAGAVGVVYLAGQYAWGKWLESRQIRAEERIAKENLRRRFEQNQEDCTYTVLALLPTVREEIINTFPVEEISNELQKQKAERVAAKSVGGISDVASSDLPSGAPSTVDDDKASLSSFQTGSYVHASQMAESSLGSGSSRPKRTRVQLWYEMKIQSIARAITLLYTLSLLTLLTRIQLNLLGRRTYLSSVVSLASPPPVGQSSGISLENNDDDNYDNVYGNDFETNRNYLSMSWWFLHRGCKEITEKVTTAVKDVFGPLNPREDITLERLSELVLEVRKKVEGATERERHERNWLPVLLPPKEQEAEVLREQGGSSLESPEPQADVYDPLANQSAIDRASGQQVDLNPSLRRLLDETSDLIESPTFTHVLTLLLNSSFSHLIDYRIATEAFKLTGDHLTAKITEITESKTKIASTLAVFCRQAHVIAAGSADVDELSAVAGAVPNEYLAAIDQVKDLEGFAAVIYSSNFEFEAAQQEQEQNKPARQSAQPPSFDAPAPQSSVAEKVVPTSGTEEIHKGEPSLPEQILGETEAALGDSLTDPATEISQQDVAEAKADANSPTPAPAFESAWVKALQKEDGVNPDNST